VGAFRAAEFIAKCDRNDVLDADAVAADAGKIIENWQKRLSGTRDWLADRKELQNRMTTYAGHLRRVAELPGAVEAAKKLYLDIVREGYPATAGANGVMNFQLALSHWGYLSAILFQVQAGVGSRGSGEVLDANGKMVPEDPSFRRMLLTSVFDGKEFKHEFVPRRPIPHTDGWFENVWADYRNRKIYR